MPRKRNLPVPANGSTLPTMVGAVIYVRVSTKEQTENLSLPTQLRACEEYCRRQGYEILERFHEEGESAKTTDRSQLQNLLTFCRLNKGRVHFVVVFNLTRFARDKYDHFALRSLLQSLGISLRSATEPIDDTSTGKLMEGVLAAFAQFDNDCRSDRTRAGMKAALELGRWVFLAPIGYLNAPRAMGKSLMPDPERAPLVRRVFEEYATGRFTKQQAARAGTSLGLDQPARSSAHIASDRRAAAESALRRHRGRPRVRRSRKARRLRAADLRGPVLPRAGGACPGDVPSTTPQQRAHPDFPLRAFVRCESCGRGLTGSWSKGRSEYYAYYHCRPGCRAVNVTKAQARRTVRRRTRAAAADARLHAATEGIRAADLEGAEGGRARGDSRTPSELQRRFRTSWTVWTKHSSSSGRSTSRPTTATPRNCARSSRSPGSTVTPASSMNST